MKSFSEELIESLPARLKYLSDQKVKEVGFGAGPSFMAQYTYIFDNSVGLSEALNHLSRYEGTIKKGRLVFDDKKTLWFWNRLFYKIDNETFGPEYGQSS